MLYNNIRKVVRTLQARGMKITKISRAMGYTTTAQLHNVLNGKSTVSIHAVLCMIDKLMVSPEFLFKGGDKIFITDKDVPKVDMVAMLQQEKQVLVDENVKITRTVQDLKRKVRKLEDKNDCILELAMTSLKYYKTTKNQ